MGMKHDMMQYEQIRFGSIQKLMKPGMLVYDIGAYDGISSALIAQAVGGSNVVIVEPSETNWATIRAYWEARKFDVPRATYAGFLGNRNKLNWAPRFAVNIGKFPAEADQFPISYAEEHSRFRSIQNPEHRPCMTLDVLSRIVGPPDGITMDVEGAEFLVLIGSQVVLSVDRPIVWVSIHPQFMKERFGDDPNLLHKFMADFGYKETLLDVDQEEHWLFEPKEKS